MTKSTTPFVAILMGSDSDLNTLEITFKTFKELNIPFEAQILSAHRTPQEAVAYIQDADQRGCAVFIAAAGLAAHLAGCTAAHTVKPVIGIPLNSGSLNGLDALLATVQMPGGTPVACVGIGDAGAMNAALLAVQILALQQPELAQQLQALRQQKKQKLTQANQRLQQQIASN